MFGYIRTYAPELKVREQESYRAAYCGLCRCMGSCCGQCSRLTLSYDLVFLALVRLCVTGERPSFSRRRCAVHPLRRRAVMEENGALNHSARCAALLNYWKLRDDLADERGLRRARARCLLPLFSLWRRRVLRRWEGPDGAIAAHLASLAALEREAVASVDLPANVFGALMRDLCAHGLEGTQAKLAGEIGYHVGRWIYMVDAADDLERDRRSGSYNPYLALLGDGAFEEIARQNMQSFLTAELMGVERALDLAEGESYPDGMAILRNILYLGMPRVAREVLWGRENADGTEKTENTENEEKDI